MTRSLPFTEFSLRRAITAARKAGLKVTGIRADGTLIVNDGVETVPRLTLEEGTADSKWEDVKA
jgi:hypothetical protein